MRFLMASTFYPPFSFGGDGLSVQQLSHALVRRGHEVTVVHDVDAYATLHRGVLPPLQEEDDDNGVRVIRLKSKMSALSSLLVHQLGRPVMHSRRLRRLFRTGGFEVVTFHNPSLLGGPDILTWPRNAVTVYMAREHWLICPTHVLWRYRRERCDRRECLRCAVAYRRPPQLWRYTDAINRALRKVDLVLALSEFSREKHRAFGLEHEMAVLPNFAPESPADLGNPPQERPYLFFAGRLERIKGLDDVLPVWRAIGEVDLLIAGEGEHGDQLRRLAGGAPNIRFLGLLPPADLPRYYRHAVATLLPSQGYEAFPRVLLESLSAGTPILARAIGPLAELVTTSAAGELFQTADQLPPLIGRLLRDPPYRARLASNALQSVRTRWSEAVVVSRFLELVETVAAAKRHHSAGRPAPLCEPS